MSQEYIDALTSSYLQGINEYHANGKAMGVLKMVKRHMGQPSADTVEEGQKIDDEATSTASEDRVGTSKVGREATKDQANSTLRADA